MLRSTTEVSRLHLTADLRIGEALSLQERKSNGLFQAEIKRFPPIEDVLAAVDTTASRVFAA